MIYSLDETNLMQKLSAYLVCSGIIKKPPFNFLYSKDFICESSVFNTRKSYIFSMYGLSKIKNISSCVLLLWATVYAVSSCFSIYRLIFQILYSSKSPHTMKFSDNTVNFAYLNNFDKNICNGITTLVAIPSAPNSFKRRSHVRKVWMSTKVSSWKELPQN